MTEEKVLQWATKIAYFDWYGDRSDSYSVYLRCENGKRVMKQDAEKEEATDQDIINIKNAIAEIIKTNWKTNEDSTISYFQGKVNYVFGRK